MKRNITTEKAQSTEQFLYVDIDRVNPSGTNPRKSYDKKKMKELEDSIREKGIIQPLLVRPFKEDAESFEIVAGERRYKAAMSIGKLQVPIIARDLTDEQALEIQVIENLQREDVHPLEEAEGYNQLMQKTNVDVKTLAAKVGKSTTYIYQRLVLTKLVEEAKQIFISNSITSHQAMMIARLTADQQEKIVKTVADDLKYSGAISNSRLEEKIASQFFTDLVATPWKKDDAELLSSAGACSVCPKRSVNNMELFGDVGKKDTCLDSVCFIKKCDAYKKLQMEKLKGEGLEPVLISHEHWPSKKGVIGPNEYEAAKKSDKDAVPGVIASGVSSGRVEYVKLKKGTESVAENTAKKQQKEKNLEEWTDFQFKELMTSMYLKLPKKVSNEFLQYFVRAEYSGYRLNEINGAFQVESVEKKHSPLQVMMLNRFLEDTRTNSYAGKVELSNEAFWKSELGIDLKKIIISAKDMFKKQQKEKKKAERVTTKVKPEEVEVKGKKKSKFTLPEREADESQIEE